MITVHFPSMRRKKCQGNGKTSLSKNARNGHNGPYNGYELCSVYVCKLLILDRIRILCTYIGRLQFRQITKNVGKRSNDL